MDDASSNPDASSSSAHPNPGLPRKSQITSCAECRRLKLRCDRVFPCHSCIRRGCANLCPAGTLEKGKRGFLKRLEQSLPSAKPGTENEPSEVAMFVARDSAMSKRIQELEAALAAAGVPVPGTAAPVAEPLQENEGRTKRPRTSSNPDPVVPELVPNAPMYVDATDVTLGFGTLTIDVEKRSRYVGPSGGAAYLNADLWKMSTGQAHSRRNSEDHENSSFGEPSTRDLADPAATRSVSPQQAEIQSKMGFVPLYDESVRLARLYFQNAAFMYEVIPQNIFFNTHLPTIYPNRGSPYVPANLHVLSLFSMVLSLGAYFDLSLSTDVVRPLAARFYELAVTAINISIPLKLDTIPAVQTLNLMALYYLSTQGETGGDAAWQVLGMAMRSMQAQGCHRDGSLWGLPQQDLEERRRVFWETHMYDRLQSFTLGRPYSQSDSHHDCEMPQSCDTPLPSDTDATDSSFSHMRWHMHKFRFARLLGRIVDQIFSATHPAYSVILELDREINAHYAALPPWIISEAVKNPIKELPEHPLAGESDMRRHAQIASLANMYFLTLLHLHRGPFCRALLLGTKNMATSKYKPSVENLTGAARAIINNARGLFALHPALLSRMWYFTFHSFTATVCLAVFVIVAPSHPLAPAAFESMQDAVELFNRAGGERAKKAAERVTWLVARARQAMDTRTQGDDSAVMQQEMTTDVTVPLRMEFPTSNLRGNPEDLLGTSTKLVRAQQLQPQPEDNLMTLPSPIPSSAAVPPPRPVSIPGSSATRFQHGSAVDRSPHSPHASYSQTAGQEHWSASHLPHSSIAVGRNPVTMHWGDPAFVPYGGSSLSIQGGSNPSHQLHHEAQTQSQYQQQGPFFDLSPYHSVDGFDVSGFIQSGAHPWMFDRGPEAEAEAEELVPPQSQPPWLDRMR